jgi:hypothetical protein
MVGRQAKHRQMHVDLQLRIMLRTFSARFLARDHRPWGIHSFRRSFRPTVDHCHQVGTACHEVRGCSKLSAWECVDAFGYILHWIDDQPERWGVYGRCIKPIDLEM